MNYYSINYVMDVHTFASIYVYMHVASIRYLAT